MKPADLTPDPVFVLLDETAPPAGHALLAGAFARLAADGLSPRALSIPCPSLPSHPLLPGTGPYQVWLTGNLPAHRAVVTASPVATLLAACHSDSKPLWLIDRDPSEDVEAGVAALAGDLLDAGVAQILATNPHVARLLGERGIRAVTPWALPAAARTATPGTDGASGRSLLVVDHSAADAGTIVAAAELTAGLDAFVVLLTDRLDPPLAASFGEVRLRPRDRGAHYARAALVLKLDSFAASQQALASILASGAALAAPREAFGPLPVVHGEHVWHLAARHGEALRNEVALLLGHPAARRAIAARGATLAQAWADDTRRQATPLPAAPPAAREAVDAIVSRLLTTGQGRTWNSTIRRRLREYGDACGSRLAAAG